MAPQMEDSDKGSENKVLVAIEKGQFVISGAAEEGGKGALVRPGKGISLSVNGRPVMDKREVFPGDVIKALGQEELREETVEVKISSDGMRAEARYFPGLKKTYYLPDHPFVEELTAEGSLFEEKISKFSETDLKEVLKIQKINFGLEDNKLPLLLNEPGTWQVVAQGRPALQGKNGWVELFFAGGVKMVKYEDEAAKVDYRKRYEIEQVEKGAVLAAIHSPVPGKAGQKVTGEEVQPDPVKRAEVNAESGTSLNPQGDKVLATSQGIPSYKKGRQHSFRVDDLYAHKGDVDIKSGNIRFHGHFKVDGDVTEGMKVAADGNVEIGGNASGAQVLAGGSVLFKGNCIKCQVRAGWVDIVLKDVYSLLEKMSGSIDSAISASEELVRALEEKGKYSEKMEAAVVRALLQSKFSELPEYALELQKSLKSIGRSMPEKTTRIIMEITPLFVDFQYSQSLGRPALFEVQEKLHQVKDEGPDVSKKADITAPYVQNSTLLCTGDILVSGPGVYNSELKCSGTVKVDRFFRGGLIEAGRDVYVGEAGTPRIASEQGAVQVSYKGQVFLGTVYENFKIRFGTTVYRFDENMNNVRLILDQEDYEVKVLSWKA